jgi:hypothetical protein
MKLPSVIRPDDSIDAINGGDAQREADQKQLDSIVERYEFLIECYTVWSDIMMKELEEATACKMVSG